LRRVDLPIRIETIEVDVRSLFVTPLDLDIEKRTALRVDAACEIEVLEDNFYPALIAYHIAAYQFFGVNFDWVLA
jgi:hypothetical protein